MRAEITIEKFQDFNTMTNRQRKEFERLLNEELSKPENQNPDFLMCHKQHLRSKKQ